MSAFDEANGQIQSEIEREATRRRALNPNWDLEPSFLDSVLPPLDEIIAANARARAGEVDLYGFVEYKDGTARLFGDTLHEINDQIEWGKREIVFITIRPNPYKGA